MQMESMKGNPTMIWKGETFIIIPNTFNSNAKSVQAGFNMDEDFRFRVRINQFTPGIYPQLEDSIIYKGNVLNIIGTKDSGDDITLIYICKLPTMDIR